MDNPRKNTWNESATHLHWYMVAVVPVVMHAASVSPGDMNAYFVETRCNTRHSDAGSVLSPPAQNDFTYFT